MGNVSASYEKWITRLLSKQRRRPKPSSLEFIRFWQKKLKIPSRSYHSIHVAGTNGKGSTCYKISNSLEKYGGKIGLFTSPHLLSFCERIQVNGVNISEEKAGELADFLQKEVGETLFSFSFFEEIFLVALLYFAEQNVDYVVWEAGIGGRLDVTNTVEPVLSIITSIGWDHMDILGNSLEQIAREKAGIIKERVPVVLGPTAIRKTCLEKAKEKRAPLHLVTGSFSFFDEENQEIARKALSVLFPQISPSFFAQELRKRPASRWEKREIKGKTLFLDGAHNVSGFESLKKILQKEFFPKKIGLVASFCKKKQGRESLKQIEPFVEGGYFAPFLSARSSSLAEIREQIKELDFPMRYFSSIKEAFEEALKAHEVILVTGSFLFMEELYPLFSQSKED